MPGSVEFWFDFSCPYAYLAAQRLDYLEARTGAHIELCPFLLGGVFRSLEVPQNLMAAQSPAKVRHNALDLQRHARSYGVPFEMPAEHPRRTVDALRVLLAAPEPSRRALMHDIFTAYWVRGWDVADRGVLQTILAGQGLEGPALLERIGHEDVKADLRARTERALERGVFGAPAFVVDGELYWGHDRMDMVESALGGAPTCPFPEVRSERLRPVEVWFDYSSPFAYLGVNAARARLGSAVRWRPMLLGAVFKAIGQANVPMSTFSEPKRRYYLRDIQRQAEAIGVPFRLPENFPINSVPALRLTLAAQARGDDPWPLIERIYRAVWDEGRDISDLGVLEGLAEEVAPEPEVLVDMVQDADIKQALRTATEAALAEGAFGAPTYVVHRADGRKSLYFGVDRLPLAAQAAAGHSAVY
ncbi:MAG: 2-hydroxychromene-2-carboxylate isomerase [Myxococcota bacterium]